ncbi:PQQ-binding-like beta-propeller repeat protein [Phytopseudomonas punonensis]|uniref:outer membrane protein assembly factor BamB family protein n=1 Tax=Phytopseudomonas punonensis TaxID=1220495 RepID=UPI001428C2D8|nr:PQQ-binding-like beta-propeller repeat protein [Pseudomonas punonensis]
MRLVTSIALVLSLSGCSFVEEAFLSAGEKLNRAFPPSPQVRVAEETLQDLLSANDSFAVRYKVLREIRGLTCSQGMEISRFDSVEKIKTRPVSRECLNAQDEILLRYLQVKQIERRLSMPALRPMIELGAPVLIPSGGSAMSAISAAAAGVAVLQDGRGGIHSIEIPGGKLIAKLATNGRYSFSEALLSPNGRVLAISSGSREGLSFYDTETAELLWQDNTLRRLLVWLPRISAALATDANGKTVVVDLLNGTFSADSSPAESPQWGFELSDGSVAIGAGRSFSSVAYERSDNVIQARVVKSYALKSGYGVSPSKPTPIFSGRALLFVGNKELLAVDLQSGEESAWKTGSLLSSRYAKLSENQILVDSLFRSSGTQSWVLNLEAKTIAPAMLPSEGVGTISGLDGRPGFIRRGGGGIWFGLKVEQGKEESLQAFLDSRNLEEQMQKLNSMSPQMGSSSASVYETSPPPPFATIAKDAVLEGVGVYESTNPLPKGKGSGNRPGIVDIAVRPVSKPVILVLSSYEAVTWRITQGRENIKLILLSSYYPSTVEGSGDTRTVVMNAGHAYDRSSPSFARLRQAVMAQTGKDLQIFQGSYNGAKFSVGGK